MTAAAPSPVVLLALDDEALDRLAERLAQRLADTRPPPIETPILLTSSRLCRRLGISRATLFRWRTKEGLAAVRVGRDDYRYELDRVLEWVRERR